MAAGKPVIVDERFYKDAGKREVDVNNARKDNNQKGTVDVDSQVYQLFHLRMMISIKIISILQVRWISPVYCQM